jgi:AAA domain-containing protein/bifunctional DNA primase/polymerase-like protein/primase-like protein
MAASFIDRAAVCVARGLKFIPLHPNSKVAVESNWEGRTYSTLEDAERLNARNPDYNIAVVFKNVPGDFWSLDTDGPKLYQKYKAETGKSIPATLTVQSRDHQHGNRIYKNTAASIAMGNIDGDDEAGEVFSARCHNRYQMFVGSIHPDTKAEYKIIEDLPIVEAPDDFIAWLLTQKTTKSSNEDRSETWMDDPIPRGKRDKTLAAVAGALNRIGMNEEAIYAVLSLKNSTQCNPPMEDSDIRRISHSVSRYEPEPTTVTFGGRPLDGIDAMKPADSPSTEELPVTVNWEDRFKAVQQLESGPIRMLIDDFLPEGMTYVGALPGEGKTLLGLSISKALTTGRNFLGSPNFEVQVIVPVIYMIPESGARAFRKRCEAFGIPNDRRRFICRTISEGATLRLDDPSLLQAIAEMRPVVILDTVIRFSDSDDENAASQNKRMVEDIIRLRQAGAVGVIGIHHSKKDMRDKGMSLENVLRGTGDIAASADAVYGMLRDDRMYDHNNGPNEIDIECVKPRDFDPPLPFRIAASRRTNNKSIGQAPGIESVIDKTGDFAIVNKDAAQVIRDAQLVRLVETDPVMTLNELAAATSLSTWVVRQNLKRLGWFKPRGGKAGTGMWTKKTKSGFEGVGETPMGGTDAVVLDAPR